MSDQGVYRAAQATLAPCHKGGFNLNGGLYKIFWMIPLFVSKIFWNILVFKIFNKVFMVNQHLKCVTKPKYELQLHLALQQYILSESAFFTKRYLRQSSFIWHIGNLYSFCVDWAMTVAVFFFVDFVIKF